jgi:hypothetical protein
MTRCKHDHDAILDRWQARETAHSIAEALGINEKSVWNVVKSARMKSDPRAIVREPPTGPRLRPDGSTGWTAARLAEAKRLYDAGYSFGRIADDIGLSRNAVIGMAHRQGWPGRKPSGTSRRTQQRRAAVAGIPKRAKNDGGALANKIAAGTFGKGNSHGGLAFKIARGALGEKTAVEFKVPKPVHVPYTGPRYGILDDRLGPLMCRAIVEGSGPETLFCSAPVVDGSPYRYCRDHAAVYLREPTGRTWSPERRQKQVLAMLRRAREVTA